MRFDRNLLKDWFESQMASSDADSRCIGHNFLIEENVSDERQLELEAHDLESASAKELFDSYYEIYVQGTMRGHVPSTFKMPMNFPALQSVAVHPSRILMRLECLDDLLSADEGIDYDELVLALNGGDPASIFELLKWFRRFPGERPVCCGLQERYSASAEEKGLAVLHHRLFRIVSPLPIRPRETVPFRAVRIYRRRSDRAGETERHRTLLRVADGFGILEQSGLFPRPAHDRPRPRREFARKPPYPSHARDSPPPFRLLHTASDPFGGMARRGKT